MDQSDLMVKLSINLPYLSLTLSCDQQQNIHRVISNGTYFILRLYIAHIMHVTNNKYGKSVTWSYLHRNKVWSDYNPSMGLAK